MATQFSVQDNKPWKRTFFTIWSGQALSILGSQAVTGLLIPAVMNMEKRGNPLPEAVGTSARRAI